MKIDESFLIYRQTVILKLDHMIVERGKSTRVVDEFNVLLPGIELFVSERGQTSNQQIIVLKGI